MMDMDELLYDLFGSSGESVERMGTWGLVACLVLTVVLAIVMFAVLVPHERHQAEHRGAKAFFNFDVLIVAPVFKFVYILLAVAIVVFGLAGIVMAIVQAVRYQISSLALAALAQLLAIVVSEVLLRLTCELVFLMVKLVGDVSAIRGRLARERAAAVPGAAPQAWQQAPAYDAGAYDAGAYQAPAPDAYAVQPTMPFEPVAGAPSGDATTVIADLDVTAVGPAAPSTQGAAGTWDCACGKTGNVGNFCTRCGRPRPQDAQG